MRSRSSSRPFELRRRPAAGWWPLALCLALPAGIAAQERPYFITYNHQMEERGNLEVSLNPVHATQRRGGGFLASWVELEYGAKGWWTTELYLDGQTTRGDSTVLSGFRWENRVRPLMLEHWINPVVYVELENINAADKTMLEVVGHDVETDHAVRNAQARRDHLHEVEIKLILSSRAADWDLAENFIAEKNLAGAPWEFGYAIGVSRPLALAARADRCRLCPENFVGGIEMYGGLGDGRAFGLKGTSRYVAPVLAWSLPGGATFRLSPGFGLNGDSHRFLLRFGASYEVSGFPQRGRGAGESRQRRLGLATAPVSAHALVSPYAGRPEAVLAGQKLFRRHCAECHGEGARGGRRAPPLDSDPVVQAPPGDLFWFLTSGNLLAGMPAWSRLPAAQRWQIVAYLKARGGEGEERPRLPTGR